MVNPSEILRRGRELLKERGWIQGQLRSKDGYCALGAVYAASAELKGGKNRREAVMTLAEVAARREGSSFASDRDVWYYNDRDGRTRKQVLSLFDTAIRRAERKELSA